MCKVNVYFIKGYCAKSDFLAYSGVRGFAAQSGGFGSVAGHRNRYALGRAKVAFHIPGRTNARCFAREINRRFPDILCARVVRN